MALHEVQLKGYSVRPGNLSLGTYDSYGIEQLHVTLDDTWSGLAIDATFHNTPSDKGVTVLADTDGLVTVPPEACKQPSKYATITFRGVQDGVQRISCNLPYMVLDHAQVPGANSTATPSEIAQALAQMQGLRDGAVDAKNQAEAARDDAANSATAAAGSEKAAASSAVAAAGSAAQAEAQKTAAETAASDAQGYMQTASSAATAANASAENAEGSKAAAENSATAAAGSEKAAASSAVAAAGSAAQAEAQKTAAETAASDAQGYMQTASSAATAANASAENAEGSKAAAENSATAAAGSATAAAGDAKIASDAAAGATDAKAAAVAAQKDAAASKAAAANSSAAAKTSEDAAAKSAADADSTANSINNSMMQIAANKEAVSQLKEDTTALQKRQNVLVGSETGNTIDVDDAFAAPLCGLTVYGRSTQDGTPTPDAPVPIVSVGDSGTIVLTLGDGDGKTQTLTLPTPNGLPGIPVTSGGNYTDQNGQQWVCDEVDLERGVKVQRVITMVFSDSLGFTEESTKNGIRFVSRSEELKKADKGTADSSAFCSALPLGREGSTWLTPNVFTITTKLYVRFENITSLGELQQYLQQTPMSLTAILATPIETPLTPDEIAAYKALTAYAPDTVVQASDGAGVKLEYQRDVNIAIKNLEDAIASMTAT